MKALHGFDSALSNRRWRSVAGPYHGGVPPYLCETLSNTQDERTYRAQVMAEADLEGLLPAAPESMEV